MYEIGNGNLDNKFLCNFQELALFQAIAKIKL